MASLRNSNQIKSNKLFTDIHKNVFEMAIKQGVSLKVQEGEIIYQNGEETDCIYLLFKGAVKIKYPSHRYISNKSANDFFGEKEFFENTRRNSSAVANSDSTLLIIPAALLKKLLDSEEKIKTNIDKFGEVELPEIYQSVKSKINLSSTNKPVSFKATDKENELFGEDLMKDSISQTVTEIIEEQLSSPASDIKKENQEIVERKILIGLGIELILSAENSEKERLGIKEVIQVGDSNTDGEELKKIFDAILITRNQLSVYDTIQAIIFAAKELLSAESGEIYLVNEGAGELLKYVDESDMLMIERFKISEGLTGTCVLQRKTLNFKEPISDSRFVSQVDQPGEATHKKILYIPLISSEDEFVGVLQVARSEKAFSDNEVRKVELISGLLAAAIEGSQRYEQAVDGERERINEGIYNFLEDNIAIPADIISSYSSVLKNDDQDSVEQHILPLLQLQVKLFRDIIKTTFDFKKQDFKLDPKKADLNKYLQIVSNLFSEYCDAREINLFIKTGSSIITNFDAGRLFMAVYQLIKNACDASKKDGKVYISLEAEDGVANIIVSDEGSGIEEFVQADLFSQVFDAAKGRERIGLALTKKIVEMHDGRIKYSTVENKGSTFIISLPIIVKLDVTSLLDHFEPAFRMDESVMDFSEYFNDVVEEEEITEV